VLAGGDNRCLSQVDADTTSFQLIKSFWHHSLLGNIEADYSPDKVVVTVFRNGKKISTRKESLNKVYYDMGQAYHVFQRLPLADGYNANVPIYMPLSNDKLELPFEVVGKETIEVPAGKFECYKVQLGIANQTIWISNDANRYIVKIEAGSVISKLEQIGINKPGEKRTYKDDEWNFSISAPVGWYFYSQNKPDEDNSKLVVLLDPEETALNMLTVSKLEDDEAKDRKADPKKALKSWADKYIEKKGKELKDFKVRPDTWKEITIGGLPALSVIADYTFQSNKKTGYSVFVMGQTNKAHFLISMCDPDKLDAHRAEFDKIVETLKIK
ncbi:MAG: DUF3108 domain-containing protein, partial [Thermoguttaceae bacterium]